MTHSTDTSRISQTGFFGMDVHQKTITIAEAWDLATPEVTCTLDHDPQVIETFFAQALQRYEHVHAVYEAGGCGYGLARKLNAMGIECLICAPSKLFRAPGRPVKNDKLDAYNLTQFLQEHILMGKATLHCVHIPEIDDEALRERTRQRHTIKGQVKTLKIQIMSMLRRYNKHYHLTKSAWTKTFRHWLQQVDFQNPLLQETFLDYLDLLDHLEKLVAQIDQKINQWVSRWKRSEVVKALSALKGIKQVAAPAIVAEISCFSRFQSAPQFMNYLGLTPCEYSSGERVTRGRITKMGNSRVRNLLVEAATSVRYRSKSRDAFAASCPKGLPKEVIDHAHLCQRRLRRRYMHLLNSGKNSNVARIAAARELAGFVWAIGVMMEKHLDHRLSQAA